MKPDDLEGELRSLKFTHLTETELAAYCEHDLDRIDCVRVETHVRQCFLCERELELLREETVALNSRATTDEDAALVERLRHYVGLTGEQSMPRPVEIARAATVRERPAEYGDEMIAGWRILLRLTVRGNQSEEVWRWESDDGKLHARAIKGEDANLMIQFASKDMRLEGGHLHFRMGSLNQELTIRRISMSEVGAQVAVPWPYRQGYAANISIEII